LGLSPQWTALLPSNNSGLHVQGRTPFLNGDAATLTGVRLYDSVCAEGRPNRFSVTVNAEELPQVWEASMHMNHGPTAMHVYNAEVRDDGQGVYLVAAGGGELTFEALRQIVEGGEPRFVQFIDEHGEPVYDANDEPVGAMVGDGVRYRPTVFSGPYMFESIDVGNGVMTLIANPHFPGTWDGFRPRIERVIWRFTPATLMVDALAAGEAHLMLAVTDGQATENAFLTLVDGGTHTFHGYDDHGQRLIQFHTDTGPTQFREVRQAISFMVDRDRYNAEVGRGYSVVAHGPWGPAWWWYQEAADRDLYDRVTLYSLNLARAIELLEEGGWNYNADGTPYVGPGIENGVRHKWVDEWHYGTDDDGNVVRFVYEINDDGTRGRPLRSNRVYTGERVLMPLVINWVVGTAPNQGRDTIELFLFENMAHAGGLLVQERNDRWGAILQGGYREAQRFEMIYLGVGMAVTWAPWLLMSLEWIPQSNWGQVDSELTRELSDRFRVLDVTTPEGYDAFVEAFIDYMEHLTFEAYTLPMRMATVHDFIPVNLGGWFTTGLWNFSEAVTRAYWR
jgi:peptide/nickel transport system substrate-binding protein